MIFNITWFALVETTCIICFGRYAWVIPGLYLGYTWVPKELKEKQPRRHNCDGAVMLRTSPSRLRCSTSVYGNSSAGLYHCHVRHQVKSLSSWAITQGQRTGGDTIVARHYSRLIIILVRCMRLSFTGSAAVAVGDAQYAEVSGAGEVPLDAVCRLRLRGYN